MVSNETDVSLMVTGKINQKLVQNPNETFLTIQLKSNNSLLNSTHNGASNKEQSKSKIHKKLKSPTKKSSSKFLPDSRPKSARKLWKSEEDMAISKLVQKYGTKKWSLISRKLQEEFHIFGRTGKQCRERWHNHLDPKVDKNPLSEEEEKLLFTEVKNIGNKWAEIAKKLEGRTDNVIKNHFYSTLRRELRKILKELFGENEAEPKEVSIKYMKDIMNKNGIGIEKIENENVKMLINVQENSESPNKTYDTNFSSHRYF